MPCNVYRRQYTSLPICFASTRASARANLSVSAVSVSANFKCQCQCSKSSRKSPLKSYMQDSYIHTCEIFLLLIVWNVCGTNNKANKNTNRHLKKCKCTWRITNIEWQNQGGNDKAGWKTNKSNLVLVNYFSPGGEILVLLKKNIDE